MEPQARQLLDSPMTPQHSVTAPDNLPLKQSLKMQNRSLSRMFAVNILTLGLYELLWLSQTRQEMVDKYNASIPKARWIIFVRMYQILAYFTVVALLFYFIPTSGKQIKAIQRPSAECFISYTQHADDVSRPVSDSCKNAVDNYFNNKASDLQEKEIHALIICFITWMLSILLYTRWLNYYAAGVARVTAGRINQTTAMTLLLLAPPTMGIIIIQTAFNGAGGDLLGRNYSE